MTLTFEISPELRAHAEKLRDWSLAEVRPRAREADRTHAPPVGWEEVVASCPLPIGRHKRRARQAYNDRFPEGSWVRELVATEALNYGDIWIGDVVGSGIGHLVVRQMGTPAQVERWYVPVAETGGPTGFALTEPGFGSDTSMVATTATRDGETWVINGTKMYCSYGAQAEYVVVFASTDRALGPSAIRAFVVERGTPGFSVPKRNEDKLGIRSWTTSELQFDDCAVPLDHQLGWVGEPAPGGAQTQAGPSGRSGALGALTANKPNISALGLGITEASLDVAGDLLHEQRASFAPHRWAGVTAELERMGAALDRVRRVNFHAQWIFDSGRSNKIEASMSKAYGPPTFERVIRRCMQLLGPEGTSTELLLEKWYRDVKILDIFEGSGQVQRIVVGRSVFGRSDAGRV